MYADDTHVTITSNNLENLLESAQRVLLNISEWMRINKLTANPKKIEYMLIKTPFNMVSGLCDTLEQSAGTAFLLILNVHRLPPAFVENSKPIF